MSRKEALQGLKVLAIDDNVYDREQVAEALSKVMEVFGVSYEFKVETVSQSADFKGKLKEIDIALIDLFLGTDEPEGMNLIEVVRRRVPRCTIIMRSNNDDIQTISKCLMKGADDFISKKSDRGELFLRIVNAYRFSQIKKGLGAPEVADNSKLPMPKVVGKTMLAISHRIPNIIDSAIKSVHITGPTGTGKEVVADLFISHLKGVPFIKINCASLSPTLMISELFGHKRGSFTGAVTDKVGLIEQAKNGWIFLDEIATLSLDAQALLLRLIENDEIKRVGDVPRKVVVRLLSATNANLPEWVDQGKFRRDLWQRLREKVIHLPPLTARGTEIRELTMHFLETMKGGPYKASPSVVEVLSSLSWREGNVRELRNCLRSMTEYAAAKLLTPLSIPAYVWQQMEKEVDLKANEIKREVSAESGESDAASPRVTELRLQWQRESDFDLVCDQLLAQILEFISQDTQDISMRRLAQLVGIPRTSLSDRIKRLIDGELLDAGAVSSLIK